MLQVIHLFWLLLSLSHFEHFWRVHLSTSSTDVSSIVGSVVKNISFIEVEINFVDEDKSIGSSLYSMQFSSFSVIVYCLIYTPESQLLWSNIEYS